MEFLRSLIDRNPPFFKDPVSLIIRHIETRHWFELGRAFLELLELEALVGERGEVYSTVIKSFERVLDPFHLAKLVFLVSEEISSPNAARKFLEDSLPKFENSTNAKNWISLQMVKPYVSNGDFDNALHLLLTIEATIDVRTDPSVHWFTKSDFRWIRHVQIMTHSMKVDSCICRHQEGVMISCSRLIWRMQHCLH
jgi:hypothetical protein